LSKKISEEIIRSLVEEEIFLRGNISFNGFVGDYKNKTTKLNLHCHVCDKSWSSTQTNTFLEKRTGCPKCAVATTKRKLSAKKDWLKENRLSPEGNLQSICKEDGKFVFYRCSECSQDKELFPNLFRLHKSDWLEGKQPCRCGSFTRWTRDQYEILCERRSEELDNGYTFLGFTGKWEGCDTKVVLSCCDHGLWGRQSIEKFLSKQPRNCPSCSRESGGFGLYKNRVLEEDTLYLLLFKDNDNKIQPFCKLGRSFDVLNRIKCIENEVKKFYKIIIVGVLKDLHITIFEIEKDIHKQLKMYHTKPEIPFGGSQLECFELSALNTKIVNKYFNLHSLV
jgi:hypothetical protein